MVTERNPLSISAQIVGGLDHTADSQSWGIAPGEAIA